MSLNRRQLLLTALLAAAPMFACAAAEPDNAKPGALRILFVGNSYTNRSWSAIVDVFKGHHLEQHTAGGARLERWAKDAKLLEQIASGKWDFVVLQEQSQVPSLNDEYVKSFMDSATSLDERIRAAGAKTVMYMTWGRRDGDARNKELNPTFEAMQARLSKSYRDAATKLHARIAPVGEVYASIKKSHPDLFPELYAGDGSHPAALGAHAVAYTMYRTMVGSVPVEHAAAKGDKYKLVAAAVTAVTSKQAD
ncbi:MAG: hypothetical protein GC159_15875 [Phycisphaera sp.]|nr:hypothetical protein [Phycisphaera sp.]